MTGRESLQGLVLPGQWPLRAPQAALPEHPLLSPGWAGGGGQGLPSGAAHPPLLCAPRSGSAPAQTHCGQGLVLGHPMCFPLSHIGAKGLPQPSGCSALLPLPQAKELALPWAAPAGSALCAMHWGAAGPAKAQAALKGDTYLPPRPRALASSCCIPSLGYPALGAAGWAQLLRACCPGCLAAPWCRFSCMMVPCIHPSPVPHAVRCCSPASLPAASLPVASFSTAHLLLLPA